MNERAIEHGFIGSAPRTLSIPPSNLIPFPLPSSTHSLWQCQHFNTVCKASRKCPVFLFTHMYANAYGHRPPFDATPGSAATLVVFTPFAYVFCTATQVTGGECCTYFIKTRTGKGCRYGECGRVHACSRCGDVKDHAHRNNCNVGRVACICTIPTRQMSICALQEKTLRHANQTYIGLRLRAHAIEYTLCSTGVPKFGRCISHESSETGHTSPC